MLCVRENHFTSLRGSRVIFTVKLCTLFVKRQFLSSSHLAHALPSFQFRSFSSDSGRSVAPVFGLTTARTALSAYAE